MEEQGGLDASMKKRVPLAVALVVREGVLVAPVPGDGEEEVEAAPARTARTAWRGKGGHLCQVPARAGGGGRGRGGAKGVSLTFSSQEI